MLEQYALQLADYCRRCGKMFTQHEPLAIVPLGEMDEVQRTLVVAVHRDLCVSPEDRVLMLGKWIYGTLTPDRLPGRR